MLKISMRRMQWMGQKLESIKMFDKSEPIENKQGFDSRALK